LIQIVVEKSRKREQNEKLIEKTFEKQISCASNVLLYTHIRLVILILSTLFQKV
jgi:hypothetical protein